MKIQVKLLKWSSFKSKIKKTKVNSSITVFDVFRRYFRVFPKVKFSNKNEVFVKLLTVFFSLYEVTVSFHELSKGRPLIWIFFKTNTINVEIANVLDIDYLQGLWLSQLSFDPRLLFCLLHHYSNKKQEGKRN